MPVSFQKLNQVSTQVVDVFRDPVGKVAVFRLRPYELDGIKLGRIRRQPSGLKPRTSAALHLGSRRSMGVQPIPNQEHGSPQMVMNGPEKSHQISRVTVMVQHVVVQAEAVRPGGDGQGANHRQAIMPVPGITDRGLPHRSPNLASQRLQQEATFIEKNNASFAFNSLFLAEATRPGAIARWRFHLVRALDVRASGRSSRVDAGSYRHNRPDTPCGTAAQSALLHAGNSIRGWESPSDPHPRSRPRPNVCGPPASIVPGGPDADCWLKRSVHLVPERASIALRTRHLHRQRQPLSSASPPALEAGLQSFDGLRAPRGCHEVSCRSLYALAQLLAH